MLRRFKALFSQTKQDNDPLLALAQSLHLQIRKQSRQPTLYREMSVPDTLDGRFEMLSLHLALVTLAISRDASETEAKALNQALFNAVFTQVEINLREAGVGDTGIPKRMKRMLEGFNGRLQTLGDIPLSDTSALRDYLRRNAYGTLREPEQEAIAALQTYVTQALTSLKVDTKTAEITFTE